MKTQILLAVILLAATAAGASVNITPQAIYESTTTWLAAEINNHKGNSVITEITISSPDLPITNAENYLGWATTQDADEASWTNGSIETNAKTVVFEYQVNAPRVTANKTIAMTVKLDSASTKHNITILDDPTPPIINNTLPTGYAKANNSAQTISATVIDSETSVNNVEYTWNDCNGTKQTIQLNKTNDTYTGTANFESYDEGEKACYTYTATNNAGETATIKGELLFDGTPPTVTINSPTAFAIEQTEFSFDAKDNVAAQLACIIKMDDTELGNLTAESGKTTKATYNLSRFSQGNHTWSVTCKDGVELNATSEQQIVLDTEPPVIALDYQQFVPRTTTSNFSAKIMDAGGIASVKATFEGNNITLNQTSDEYSGSISSAALGEKTFEIQATDSAGHVTTKTAKITIIPNHQITLTLSPDSTQQGKTITTSGALTPEGTVESNNITIQTPNGELAAQLANNTYSTTFTAPGPGTYIITAEYKEAGYTYKAEATLNVEGATVEKQYYSSGTGFDSWRYEGHVKPHENPETDEVKQETKPEEPPAPEPAPVYEPLPAQKPREAYAPKATGVFTLGKTIKWLALLLAIGLITGLGVYAYKKRPKDDGIDWEGYFKGNGA